MALSVETITKEALELPSSPRASMVEILLASLAGEVDSGIERAHLQEISLRRAAVDAGNSVLVDGAEAFFQARAALGK